MTEKILARHAGRPQAAPGDNIWVNVDILMTHDVCGPGTIGIFRKQFGPNAKVWDRHKVERFVTAWESADLDGLIALLTDDVFMAMPPIPFEYEGRELVGRFCATIFDAGRRFDLVLTRANDQPALGAYVRRPDGTSVAVGLYVLALAGDRIDSLIRFEPTVFPWFGLPETPSGGDAPRVDR